MAEINDNDEKKPALIVDEESGTVAFATDKEVTPEQMKEYLSRQDVWAIFGLGLDYPPVGGLVRPDLDPDLPPADRVVPERVRGQVKRHLIDPTELGIILGPEAGFDRLLLLEYPIIEGDETFTPATKPFWFGKTRIDGGWAVLWHDSKTGTDKYIHCPNCIQTTMGGLFYSQQEQTDAAAYRKTLN